MACTLFILHASASTGGDAVSAHKSDSIWTFIEQTQKLADVRDEGRTRLHLHLDYVNGNNHQEHYARYADDMSFYAHHSQDDLYYYAFSVHIAMMAKNEKKEEALREAERELEAARKEHSRERQGRAECVLGYLCDQMDRRAESADYYRDAIDALREVPDKQTLWLSYMGFCNEASRLGNVEEAKQRLLECGALIRSEYADANNPDARYWWELYTSVATNVYMRTDATPTDAIYEKASAWWATAYGAGPTEDWWSAYWKIAAIVFLSLLSLLNEWGASSRRDDHEYKIWRNPQPQSLALEDASPEVPDTAFTELSGQRRVESQKLMELMADKTLLARPDLNRKTLAYMLNTNETYLRESIRERYDLSVSEYITGVRMDYARQLLLSGLKMPEIIQLSGIGSTSTFYRLFSKYFGTTPELYRKKQGKNP
ncbi:MAG: helix-turn-helix transcriptional regulator [Mediterranea sp.]|jgi:AraC-like DNA-binding protein|nr:helix-turn-helix transcriptional regulator [Mediterranea sp.]